MLFRSLFVNEIVKVQPLTAPSGLSFYMDYKFDEKKYDANEGDE